MNAAFTTLFQHLHPFVADRRTGINVRGIRMRIRLSVLGSIALAIAPAMAAAETPVMQAIQVGSEGIRYDKGLPTVDLQMRDGAVQVRPLGMDHGRHVFAVAVFNDGRMPANFDISNVAVSVGSQRVPILGVDALIKKAKSRSTWSQLGIALLGGLSAGAASSQTNTYTGHYSTPYGTYTSSFTAPSLAGQLRASRIEDATAYRLAGMQAQLDATRDALSDQIIQLSTVNPGQMYAGKVVLEKFDDDRLPLRVDLAISWNGEIYPFAFQLAREGTPAPAFMPASAPLARREAMPAVAVAGSPVVPVRVRTSIGQTSAPTPRGVDMEGIVSKTASVMPRPFALETGTLLTSYRADGTTLHVTAKPDFQMYARSEWEEGALAEMCAARPFAGIIHQGGTVKATYVESGNRELGVLEVNEAQCGPRRG